jgi:hypothetical protein
MCTYVVLFTQSKLYVRVADKQVMISNNKDHRPFTVIPQSIKIFFSVPCSPLLSLFFPSFSLLLFPSFPSFLLSLPPSVYLFIFIFSSFLFFPCVPLHFFIDHALLLFSSPFIFYGFVCILFFLSFYFFLPLCICVGLNATSFVCGMWKS